eukprot:CAMPEP_0173217010 /NCGR_PEP_ID=MMETSP1142-20121109/246_1 /TAXON_ID=483371 /ORGANISM="non described non described, Strain CCMP2298" /LENGTH=66 /DNA_ID=CAMNT_0014144519 /DNA_START=996 /DNA_END=1196 /DNA_ORIENTATION=+
MGEREQGQSYGAADLEPREQGELVAFHGRGSEHGSGASKCGAPDRLSLYNMTRQRCTSVAGIRGGA